MVSRLQQEIKQTKPFSSLKQEVLLSIARTAAVLQHASEQALKAHGITLTQYNVLRILRGAGEKGLCRHEIASRLITPVPDVSRLLDRMVRAGLVTRTRDKHDRRLVASCITHSGLELLDRLDSPMLELTSQQFRSMEREELEKLLRLLDRARDPA
jgi:DNA-binding MarR family transcriptional regulator